MWRGCWTDINRIIHSCAIWVIRYFELPSVCILKKIAFLYLLRFCGSVKLSIDISIGSQVLSVERVSPFYVINVASGSLCLALHQGSSLLSAFLNRAWYCAWFSALWKSHYFTSRRPQAIECRLQWAVIAAQENVKILFEMCFKAWIFFEQDLTALDVDCWIFWWRFSIFVLRKAAYACGTVT